MNWLSSAQSMCVTPPLSPLQYPTRDPTPCGRVTPYTSTHPSSEPTARKSPLGLNLKTQENEATGSERMEEGRRGEGREGGRGGEGEEGRERRGGEGAFRRAHTALFENEITTQLCPMTHPAVELFHLHKYLLKQTISMAPGLGVYWHTTPVSDPDIPAQQFTHGCSGIN